MSRCYGFGYKPESWDAKEFNPEKMSNYETEPIIKTAYLIHKEGRLKWFVRQLYNLVINGYTEERRPLLYEVLQYESTTVHQWRKIEAWREA